MWAALWVGAALLDLLPGNRPASSLTAELSANATSVPAWLAELDHGLSRGTHVLGGGATALLVGLGLTIGLASLGKGTMRSLAVWSGIGLAGLFWAAGQSFGQLFSGQATDPNTGPLVILLGLAVISIPSSETRRQDVDTFEQRHVALPANATGSPSSPTGSSIGHAHQVNRPVATMLPEPSTTLTVRTDVADTGRTVTQDP